ncbi:unnamed protein product [Medioppia subpectinata]|uniref:KASH domain-containing protein n=1 Tax=Medioppia subpectinata TaxID=1979941 RepID=A0A7R9KWI5_9ACAR|nr:unnamed protein product [Medioppia subpectinata]CAG2111139.1 unnamed protein product [Medioppia subpectinata]
MESELSSMKCLHPNEGNDQNLENIHHREEHCSDLETSTRLKRDINDENLYDADISDNINNGIESDNEDNLRSESPELLATNKDTQRAPKRNLLNYMSRALRASIPIQALMFILLGAASLVPTVDEDYSCQLMNNLLHSFQPMLDYPNGPPPV